MIDKTFERSQQALRVMSTEVETSMHTANRPLDYARGDVYSLEVPIMHF